MRAPTSRLPALVAAGACIAVVGCSGAATESAPPATDAPPASAPPTDAPPTSAPSTSAPSTDGPTASAPPTSARRVDVGTVLDEVRDRYPAPGGLALVRRDGEEVFAASGTADLAGTPITADTRFRIASITKPIVSALVLDAVRRGEVGLDDVVAELVPGVVRDEPPITVRMLLDHTSGIFDEGNEGDVVADVAALTDQVLRDEASELMVSYAADGSGIASDRLIVALAETHPRYDAPGRSFHYSNPNYQVAAMVLEAVTGQSLAALLADRVAGPLALGDMTIAPPDLSPPDLRGYGTSVDDGSLVDVTDDLLAFGNGGNGGVVASAGDLMRTMRAIVSGELVDGALRDEMTTPTAESLRAGAAYGLGLARYRLACGTFYGHEGGVNGTASIALSSLDGDDAVVVALNLRDGTDPRLPAIGERLLC